MASPTVQLRRELIRFASGSVNREQLLDVLTNRLFFHQLVPIRVFRRGSLEMYVSLPIDQDELGNNVPIRGKSHESSHIGAGRPGYREINTLFSCEGLYKQIRIRIYGYVDHL